MDTSDAAPRGTVTLPGAAGLQALLEVLVLHRDFPAWAVWFPGSGGQWAAARPASARPPGAGTMMLWVHAATMDELMAMMRVADRRLSVPAGAGQGLAPVERLVGLLVLLVLLRTVIAVSLIGSGRRTSVGRLQVARFTRFCEYLTKLTEPGIPTFLRRTSEPVSAEKDAEPGDLSEGQAVEAHLRSAAEAGDADAACELGALLAERGDEEEAGRWLQRAAEAGNSEAASNLGIILFNREEFTAAERWLRQGAEAGHPNAAHGLGQVLFERDEATEAEQWLRRGAEAGDPGAACTLATVLYSQGETGQARHWFRQAAEGGNAEAPNLLAHLLYSEGEKPEAERWFTVAAEAGDADAAISLGDMLVERGNLAEAESWYLRAADSGSDEGAFNLGWLYWNQGYLQDAERWHRKAAEHGHGQAANQLGYLMRQKSDSAEAERWFRVAAEAGDPSGANNLGSMLQDRGETWEAEQWYRRAASAGNDSASNNLGTLLDDRGDLAEAERWYRRAADAGIAAGARNLASLLRKYGDTRGADEWHRRASEMASGDEAPSGGAKPFTPRRRDDLQAQVSGEDVTRRPRTVKRFSDTPPGDGMADIITCWDRMLQMSPDPATAVSYLARRSGLPFHRIDHIREVRNCCAHPNSHGWPSQHDVDTANATAREIFSRLTG